MVDQSLSKREREILTLAADGDYDKEIAAKLGIAIGSVRTYWERIRNKMDVKSRAHAVSLWARSDNGVHQKPADTSLLEPFMNSAITPALIIINDKGRFTHWSPGVQKLFGYTESEFIGQGFDILFTPEDRASGRAEKQLRRAREVGPVCEVHWHCHKNGEKLWLRGVLYALWDHGLAGYGKIVELAYDAPLAVA